MSSFIAEARAKQGGRYVSHIMATVSGLVDEARTRGLTPRLQRAIKILAPFCQTMDPRFFKVELLEDIIPFSEFRPITASLSRPYLYIDFGPWYEGLYDQSMVGIPLVEDPVDLYYSRSFDSTAEQRSHCYTQWVDGQVLRDFSDLMLY